MLRYALAAALGFATIMLVGVSTTTAEDKKEEKKDTKKTLEGKLVCGKCKLKETEECSNVLVVKEKDKEVKYYLSDKGKPETYHKCSGEANATVTGKVVEKDKKFTIEDPKVEVKK